MKNILFSLAALTAICTACNNSGKDSVEKADSANEAKLDTGLNRNTIVVDEASSAFLVRVANSGMAEVAVASHAHDNAYYNDVKSFASMLHHDHASLNDTVKSLAARKAISLPAAITPEKQKEVDDFVKKTGKDLDREFVNMMIKNHESSISSFEAALLDAKDPDVRSFADKTLPALRAHLDSAKALHKKHW